MIFSKEQSEGKGATVRRSIGRPELRNLDPFIMLDEGFVGPPAGFPDHPHRGFETVSYILSGKLCHEDFCGHKGILEKGDLQWMTAGSGIVHCEMPLEEGHFLQLWVNLPAKYKMCPPSYQELKSETIPCISKDGVTVRVIAGESMGTQSTIYTRTPTMYLDFKIEANCSFKQVVPIGWTAFIYILSGEAHFGSAGSSNCKLGTAHYTLVLSDGEFIEINNNSLEYCHFILVGGQPINEPVVQHGPFVMNSQEEINVAISDYRNCKNGFEKAKSWKSYVYK